MPGGRLACLSSKLDSRPMNQPRRIFSPFLACAVVFLALSLRQPALLGPALVFLALAIRPLWQGRGR